jgi:hypothetical protein
MLSGAQAGWIDADPIAAGVAVLALVAVAATYRVRRWLDGRRPRSRG